MQSRSLRTGKRAQRWAAPARMRRRPRDIEAESAPQLGTAPRLYQRVCDILAGQIQSGQLTAGAPLKETGVAAMFGISRAPVRQALAELEEKGLILKAEGRGYIVSGGRLGEAAAPASIVAEPAVRLLPFPSWEAIYAEVEREIAARIAFASWRVNEAELARAYKVSRTVARDVVGRLHQRGVVRKDDSSRWYAPGLTPDHVGELYEMRWLLEPVALMKAAPQVAPEFIAGMRAELDSAIAHARTITGATLDQLETSMHATLLAHCGNQTLMQAITLPQSLLIAHRFLYRWTPRLFDTEPFLPEHLEVVDLLQQGKAEKAAKALGQHLRVSLQRAIARIAVIAQEFRPDELPYLKQIAPDSR
jgi:DNA-binding GntR family transcriptional regulator